MQIPTGGDIRTARKNQGMTQTELAERAGVSQPLIARIESNDVDPTIDTLYNIVSALNDSTVELDQEEIQISMPSVLKEARNRTGYTQGELAEAADVSQPLISRIERQDVNPRASTLRKIFSHLDPLPHADYEGASTQSSTEHGLIESIEREFEKLEGASFQSGSEITDAETSEEINRCTECGTSLSAYPDPKYCHNCGTKL